VPLYMATSAGVDEPVISASRFVPVPGPQAHAGGAVDLLKRRDAVTFCAGESTDTTTECQPYEPS